MIRRTSALTPVFADTSAFYAFAAPHDRDHAQAVALYRTLSSSSYAVFTTNLILAETHVLLKSRLTLRVSRERARTLALQTIGEIYRSSITVEPVLSKDEQLALDLLARYIDHDFSFTDATSFIVMRRLDIKLAFTFDNDFVQAGFTDLRHALA